MDACTEERFLSDVYEHNMEIVHEHGLYRHLKFTKPDTLYDPFELITWPGYLCVAGSRGVYTFTRLSDMFELFRGDGLGGYDNKVLYINKRKWSEFLVGQDCHSGIKEFSIAAFTLAVKNAFDVYFARCESADLATAFAIKMEACNKESCWEKIEEQVLNRTSEQEALIALSTFKYRSFTFSGFRKYQTTDYAFNYLWCLYAIVWGIQQYDAKTNYWEKIRGGKK